MAYDYNPQFNFKPEFGNLDHLRIVQAIGKLSKKHVELKRKRDSQKGGDTLEKECVQLRATIEHAIKNVNKTNTEKTA